MSALEREVQDLRASGASFIAFDMPGPIRTLTPVERGFLPRAELVDYFAANGWWAGLLHTPCTACRCLPTRWPAGCIPGISQPTVQHGGQVFHGERLALASSIYYEAVGS
jgi:hypothetical protein